MNLSPEDFFSSQEAIESTFVMSNVFFQRGSVNSGAYAKLEKKVRSWACGDENITVYTGLVIENGLNTLPAGVIIPNELFKVVIDNTPPKKVIAFIYNQTEKAQRMENKVVSHAQLKNYQDLGVEKEIKSSAISENI